MAKSYTIKTNSDGSVTTTKVNNDGSTSSSTSTSGAKNYDSKAGAYVSDSTAKANASTYSSNGSNSKYAYGTDGTAYVVGGRSGNSGSTSSTSSTSGSSDYNTMANRLATAQKEAQIAQLKNAYNNTINQIAQQEKETSNTAQSNRNMASVQSQLAAKQLANKMAELGLSNSGTNAQMMTNNAGALQNTLGSITSNEQQALQELANQRTLAYNNLQNDISSANANVDANTLQNQLSYLQSMQQLQAQQQYALEQMEKQRAYDQEDYTKQLNDNYTTYTDPLTGQSYLAPVTSVMSANNNLYNTQLTNSLKYSNGGTSGTTSKSSAKSTTSSTSSSGAKASNDRTIESLTNSQYNTIRSKYNTAVANGETTDSFNTWVAKNYGYKSNTAVFGAEGLQTNTYTGDTKHDSIVALNEAVLKGTIGQTYIMTHKSEIINTIGETNYNTLLRMANGKSIGKSVTAE